MKRFQLFLTIFLAVYFANLASHFTQTYLWTEAIKLELKQFSSSIKPKQTNSTSLQSDLNALRNAPRSKPAPTTSVKNKKTDNELNNAFELCLFWTKAHLEKLADRAEINMKESCDAYNNLKRKRGLSPLN